VSERLGRELYLDLDVVPEAVQARHQLALGQVGEVAAQHGRDLRLRDSHAAPGLLLRQAEAAHGARDLDDQAGLDLELFGTILSLARTMSISCFGVAIHGIDDTVCAAGIVFNDSQNAGASPAAERRHHLRGEQLRARGSDPAAPIARSRCRTGSLTAEKTVVAPFEL
jgi:hypothetical protein